MNTGPGVSRRPRSGRRRRSQGVEVAAPAAPAAEALDSAGCPQRRVAACIQTFAAARPPSTPENQAGPARPGVEARAVAAPSLRPESAGRLAPPRKPPLRPPSADRPSDARPLQRGPLVLHCSGPRRSIGSPTAAGPCRAHRSTLRARRPSSAHALAVGAQRQRSLDPSAPLRAARPRLVARRSWPRGSPKDSDAVYALPAAPFDEGADNALFGARGRRARARGPGLIVVREIRKCRPHAAEGTRRRAFGQ